MLQLPLPVAIVCHVQAGCALAHGISSRDRWVAAQFFGIWVRAAWVHPGEAGAKRGKPWETYKFDGHLE